MNKKKKKLKKSIRQVEKELGMDSDSILGEIITDGLSALLDDEDDSSEDLFEKSSSENDSKSEDFGGGAFGGGGSDDSW